MARSTSRDLLRPVASLWFFRTSMALAEIKNVCFFFMCRGYAQSGNIVKTFSIFFLTIIP
jgi:hypothetical protein